MLNIANVEVESSKEIMTVLHSIIEIIEQTTEKKLKKINFLNTKVYLGEIFIEPHGHGCMRWPDNRFYAGQFYNGKMDGWGTYKYPNGSIYEGEFFNDEFHGYGMYHSHEGIIYSGQMVQGYRHGFGELINTNTNHIIQGIFENDEIKVHFNRLEMNKIPFDFFLSIQKANEARVIAIEKYFICRDIEIQVEIQNLYKIDEKEFNKLEEVEKSLIKSDDERKLYNNQVKEEINHLEKQIYESRLVEAQENAKQKLLSEEIKKKKIFFESIEKYSKILEENEKEYMIISNLHQMTFDELQNKKKIIDSLKTH